MGEGGNATIGIFPVRIGLEVSDTPYEATDNASQRLTKWQR